MFGNMRILSIETSCDESAISIIKAEKSKEKSDENYDFEILANIVASQIDIHQEFGGVFPMIAKREHQKALVPLLLKIIGNEEIASGEKDLNEENEEVKIKKQEKIEKIQKTLEREPELLEIFLQNIDKIQNPNIDLIAVTNGPGLAPALWVGVSFAKALAELWDIKIIAVNHMEGHIFSSMVPPSENAFSLPKINFPAISLLVSGGHTEIILVKDWMDYEKIGQTVDDAVGEAFDKCARMLGLPYPGGPQIGKLAQIARENNLQDENIEPFPRPMIHSGDFNFSYSGLKTAVLYKIQKLKILNLEINNSEELSKNQKMIISKEFENAAIEVLISKTKKALIENSASVLIIGGGVANNKYLKEELNKHLLEENIVEKIFIPRMDCSTDNSIMIGITGAMNYFKDGKTAEINELVADSGLSL